MRAITNTDLPLDNRREGKVRELYDIPRQADGIPRLLIVATDRVSAFDIVLPTPIPGKGATLTRMTTQWFGFLERRRLARTHLISADTRPVPRLSPEQHERIQGRALVVRRCAITPIECVVRGYLEGSGWADYQQTGAVSGLELPAGLKQGDKLPEPLFTPATKAPAGEHDQNISLEQASDIVGGDLVNQLADISLRIYHAAHDYAEQRGVILADTKFEFGHPVDDHGEPLGGPPLLADEALTPDSSRYWPADRWSPGGPQPSFDKQFVREHLQRLVDRGAWDKTHPGPELPPDVVQGTADRYAEAERLLFGAPPARRNLGFNARS